MSVLSVVQEVIEFFVMAFQFGVPQALFGVRRMLPLIWSKEPGVREAVLNAYRQLYLNPKGDSARYMILLPLLTFLMSASQDVSSLLKKLRVGGHPSRGVLSP